MMIQYDAFEALRSLIHCDDYNGQVEKYTELGRVAKARGVLSIAQLSHPGRQVGNALNPIQFVRVRYS